jgi:hypothetical protein
MFVAGNIHTIAEDPVRGREEATDAVVKVFRKRKILTLQEIQEIAGWSPMTLWRNLKPIGYCTSFNCNARYYTLAGIPRFDENGLWFYRTVGFSSYGTLNRTIVARVESSAMGFTPNELSTILTVRVQNQVARLHAENQLGRFRCGRAQLYVSVQEAVQAEQMRRRDAQRLLTERRELPPTQEETIEILAELVRTPGASARGIAFQLNARGLNITRPDVLAVIEKYGLKKKRRSRRSKY